MASTGMPAQEVMPAGALPAAVVVILYSVVCLSCGVLLAIALHRNQERLTYVHLFAVTTILQTLTAIIQQIYYIVRWRSSKIDSYNAALATAADPSLILGPQSTGFGRATYWIQTYFFNTNALILLFWAIALTANIYASRVKYLRQHTLLLGNASKVVAYVAPALVVLIRATTKPKMSFGAGLFANNVLVFLSLTLGAICMVLILVKYLQSRLGPSTSNNTSGSQVKSSSGISTTRSRLNFLKVDPWLIVRFSIAFAILSGLNIFLVLYSISRYQTTMQKATATSPDFSTATAVRDSLNYMPPVTCSLLAFLLFGLTASARAQYASMFPCCTVRLRNNGTTPTASRIRGSTAVEWNNLSSQRRSLGGIQVSRSIEQDLYYEMPATPLTPLSYEKPGAGVKSPDIAVQGVTKFPYP